MVRALKAVGSQVVICTNGLPLQNPAVCTALLEDGADAVSVSLDSHDHTYNDHWRPDRTGSGWHGVVTGIRTLVQRRDALKSLCKVGLYMVVTALNVHHIVKTAQLAMELGLDYFVFQPVSLSSTHPHSDILSLNCSHIVGIDVELGRLYREALDLLLPTQEYVALERKAIIAGCPEYMADCFGGRDLFFIEPDGSVWDCPSYLKIAKTPTTRRTSIRHSAPTEIFSLARRSECTDCEYFSVDCVNMWHLMSFNRILGGHDPIIGDV
jgi:MoaA/NifB/PqqE/SkfB family radical SAM enzyme